MKRVNFVRKNLPRKEFLGALAHSWFFIFFFIFFLAHTASAQETGVYHLVTKGVTLYRISLAYKIPLFKLMEANGITSPSSLKIGSRLFIPGVKEVVRIEPAVPFSPLEKKDLEHSLENEEKTISGESLDNLTKETPPWFGDELDLLWPIQGKINSPFGLRGKKLHAGIDIASPSYQEVKAAMDGEVVLARYSPKGYGNVVVLRHGQNYSTIYGHLNVIIAKEGEEVRQGQAIGGVGSTGNSTGPHLHFEIRLKENPFDPLPFMPMTMEELLENGLQN